MTQRPDGASEQKGHFTIAAIEDGLSNWTRESYPAQWATARTNTGLAYARQSEGDPSQNWELAVAAFEDALSVWTREHHPEQWAAARMNLAVAYRERLAGDRSDNQERAIGAFEDTLSVWSREGDPGEWAAVRMNLGIAYWERLAGDRAENRERAISAFEDSLSVWTRDGHPEDWATAHLNLGFAYRERTGGDRSKNEEQAISAFENGLSVWTREHHSEQWAAARMSLGMVYWERLAGDRSQNRELALSAFEDALSVWTRERDPDQWAAARMNLGIAYWERLAGDQSENRERAIAAFDDALSIWTRAANPERWAAGRMKLGVAYQERLVGDRSENRERAIAAFEDTLSVWAREANPEAWAAARMNLGAAYWERLADDRSENQEQAIAAFQDALSVWTREANPESWAAGCMKLGVGWQERLAGDRSENLERAIRAFDDALSVWTRVANPQRWAAAQMKLGIAYRDRLAGDRSENREQAIAAFDQALMVWTTQRYPEEAAVARANLDTAHRERFGEWLDSRVSIGPVAPQDVKVIGLVSSAHFMSHFFQIVLPPLFPLLKGAFGVGYAELSIVMSLMYATSGLMQTSAGFIVDRLGPARVLIGGLGLYSVAVLLYGFAPNLWVMAALAVAAGLGNCVFHPADYAILSARVGGTRLGRAYGVHNLGGSLGWAAAPPAVIGLSALFGWRVALSILGGLGLLLTVCLVVQAAALTTERRTPRASEAAPSAAKMFLSQPILVCFGYFTLLAVATVALQAFLPSSLVSGFGISFEVANTALTGFLVGSALGMFVGGIIADRFGRHELVVATGLSTAAMVSLAIGILAMPVAALILVIALGGFAWGCTTPSRDLLVRRAAPAGAMGAVVGFVYSGLDLGSAVTPPFLGFLLDHHLPRLIFIVTAGVLVLAISTAFVIGRNNAGRRSVRQPEGFEPVTVDSVA